MGGKADAPDPDPLIGQAAQANAEVGKEAMQLARTQYADTKALTDRYLPLYDQMIAATANEQTRNAANAQDQWDQYKNVFQPIENQMAQEAVNYDSAEEVGRREGLASATVAKQFDATQDQLNRNLARIGASPTSSLGAQAKRDQANAEALAKAGAITQERNNTKLLGMSMRQDAARFGRNQTGTGLAASAATLNSANATGGLMGQSVGSAGAATSQAQGMMGVGVQANNSAGQLALSKWNTQVQQANSQNESSGQLLGTVIGAGAMMMSSEDVKENKTPVDDQAALEGLSQIPVEQWKYKEGVADEGEHIGPYAQDMNKQFGDNVAPGGQQIDIVSNLGLQHAAIRALKTGLDQVNAKLDGKAKAGAKPAKEKKTAGISDIYKVDISHELAGLEKI